MLEKCPFCGGEARLLGGPPHNSYYWVQCSECHCRSDLYRNDYVAVQSWNNRFRTEAERQANREVLEWLAHQEWMNTQTTPGEALAKAVFWEVMKMKDWQREGLN